MNDELYYHSQHSTLYSIFPQIAQMTQIYSRTLSPLSYRDTISYAPHPTLLRRVGLLIVACSACNRLICNSNSQLSTLHSQHFTLNSQLFTSVS